MVARSDGCCVFHALRLRSFVKPCSWPDKLTAENKNVLKQNRTLKRQLATQAEDREFLVKQLV